jgi:hypothetical protein
VGRSDGVAFVRTVVTGLVHSGPESAFLPQGLAIFDDLTARSLDHRWILSVKSSQAYAINAFAPLEESGLKRVFGMLGHDVASVEAAEFEYSDPDDRLAESSPRSRHQTQVDVVLRGEDVAGRRVAALIEVKFTEKDFGDCSAYENPANPTRSVCHTPGIFGGQPEACFQLANHGHGQRRYADYLAGVPVTIPSGGTSDGGCLVRRGLSQPMRNLALAHLLLREDEADLVVYALFAPTGHAAIWRRFEEVQSAFPDMPQRTIRPLIAEDVVRHHPDGGAAFRTLYRISEPQLTDRSASSGF